ncbi:MAG: hypothetical protein ACOYBY_05425 [Dermatophilaceae bacterium]
MKEPSPERVVQEYAPLRDPGADPTLEAVKAALALEDAIGVVIPAELLDPAYLGTDEAMSSTAQRLAGGR